MTDEQEWYAELLELQLQANPGIWAGLRGRGATDQTQLRLAFAYLSPGQTEADRLVAFLQAETDYEVKTHSQREGRVVRREWFVVGVTQPAVLSRDTVDAWVEWMIAAGAAHGPCAFDGWAGQF